ncbi:unnamed protein product, partial [Iphiclides podalirius]
MGGGGGGGFGRTPGRVAGAGCQREISRAVKSVELSVRRHATSVVRPAARRDLRARVVYRQRPSHAARRQPPRPPLHLGLQHRPGLPTTSLNDARLAPFDTVLRAQP